MQIENAVDIHVSMIFRLKGAALQGMIFSIKNCLNRNTESFYLNFCLFCKFISGDIMWLLFIFELNVSKFF